MIKKLIRTLIVVAVSLFLGLGIAWLAGKDGAYHGQLPVFVICALLAFAINWIVFIPSFLAKTERFYDLTGTVTYLSVIATALVLSQNLSGRAIIVAALVYIWAFRLGSFLFARILRDGKDRRFDAIKVNPLRFFGAWTLQALWVTLTSAAALTIITSAYQSPLEVIGFIGIALWIFGFLIEFIADRQKSAFKKDPANEGKFINSGLWAWSQHPNYFGEIILWVGIFVLAVPVLSGSQWAAVISPVFVYFLLTRLSGIPTLEKYGLQKWGDDPAYQTYIKNTPALLLRPPKS